MHGSGDRGCPCPSVSQLGSSEPAGHQAMCQAWLGAWRPGGLLPPGFLKVLSAIWLHIPAEDLIACSNTYTYHIIDILSHLSSKQPPRLIITIPTQQMGKVLGKLLFPSQCLPRPYMSFKARLTQNPPALDPSDTLQKE